ncbi:autotransporter outer membrane beta-barrel domain-containing protein [uncultured Megasphaera sp.]|uniref:autotransporter outer membrane beta-barrel domain-containing protein n=1 Tax=uncultured Megasphaera sp. TaxID=165188 RepID=UPI00258E013B|nr:autotransporter outer membrane beta-barrel domain-containing protein [uncultured Megasphaera sp.]
MKQHSRSTISGLILSSILGVTLQAPPVQAAAISLTGDQVQAETGDTSGYGIREINMDNPAIGNKDTNTASNNTLTISGGIITSEPSGSDIFGGLVREEENATMTAASSNTVTVSDTLLGDGAGSISIFGGYLIDWNVATAESVLAIPVSNESFTVAGNTVTVNPTSVADGTAVSVYGGAAYVWGSATTTSGSKIGIVYDKFVAAGNVTGNAVYIGTSADEEAVGTYATSGDSGTYDSVYGGRSMKGQATGNTVVMRNSTLTNTVVGGSAYFQEANKNHVTLDNITIGPDTSGKDGDNGVEIYGGNGMNLASANENVLTLTHVNVANSERKVYAIGGLANGDTKDPIGTEINKEAEAAKSDGDANGNIVNITDSNLYVAAGGVSSTEHDIMIPTDHSGADFAALCFYRDAIGNEITIQETTSGATTIRGAVYGGAAMRNALDNEATLISGTASKIIGGEAIYADATGNIVAVGKADYSTTTVIGNTLVGGYTVGRSGSIHDNPTANDNTVSVYGGTIGASVGDIWGIMTEFNDPPQGLIAGGMAPPSFSANNRYLTSSTSSGNSVQISHSTITDGISDIYGGWALSEASGNSVTLSDTNVTLGTSFYEVTYDGKTQQKSYLHSDKDTASRIIGGEASNGSASGNSVTISGKGAELNDISYIIGGKAYLDEKKPAEKAEALGNTVSISDVTITGAEDGLTIIGAEGQTRAGVNTEETGSTEEAGNTLSITDATIKNVTTIYGSHSEDGSVSGTTLSLKNSILEGNDLEMLGAYTESDIAANDNTITIDATDITGLKYLYGSASGGTAAGNTFTIKNNSHLTFNQGTLIGAYGDTTTNNNELTLENTTLTNITQLIGAESYAGKVEHNTTSITGGSLSFTGEAYGGGPAIVGGYMGILVNDNDLSLTGVNVTGAKAIAGGYGYYYANDNTVKITKSTAADTESIYGGRSSTQADDNEVSISDSSLTKLQEITGGISEGEELEYYDDETESIITISPSANVNKVSVSGGTVTIEKLYGGWLKDSDEDTQGTTDSNTVTLGDGVTAGTVIGGNNKLGGSSSKNTVTINGGTVEEDVVAGQTPAGDASGNTLDIYGGTIGTTDAAEENTNLIAAAYTKDGAADSNTVNVYGGTLGVMMSLYGGYTPAAITKSTNNTLNMYTTNNTVENLGYFQTLNFYVPGETQANDTVLEVTQTADVHGAAINAGVAKSVGLRPGQHINLIHDANTIDTTSGTTYSMMPDRDYVVTPGLVRYDVLIKKQDPETIVLYIPEDSKGTVIPATKLMTSQRNRAISTVTDVTDTASTSGYEAAIAAWNTETGVRGNMGGNYGDAGWEDHEVWKKYTPYVLLGGNDLRYDADSTTNTQGFNSELGFVKRSYHDDYIDTYMPFLEYGNGNYTERYQGSRGDGNQQYIGAGILVRRDRTDGLHYEAVLRAGQLNTDYHADIAGHHISYDTDTNYVAAQLGLGKLYTHKDNNYDIYTKLFWSHIFSDDVDIYSDLGKAQYQFDSADSIRSRIGFRWTKHYQENQTYYVGLGWDHEFDGTARATYNNFNLPEKDGKGDAGFLELGWSSQSHKDNPWNADVKLRGWVGMKKGIDYTLTIGRAF